jgi:hypothetical protein
MNGLARFEMNLIDDPREISAHGHALNGGGCANHIERRWPGLSVSNDRGDRIWRRRKAGTLRDGSLNLFVLYESKAGDNDYNDRQHEKHPFRHNSP